ncbi:MAG: acetylxylan esterase [Fimbriimonadaceae bacterium]|nr:acetylxylan esterase [Fimbriimonadaceae bacterium]QYK55100.1 MAG: acetylxylan esterase [Fimbriimonadaceae bacterium]
MTDEFAPYPPEDFSSFWEDTVAEALAEPLDFRRSGSNDYLRKGFTIESFTFRGYGGTTRHGWLASPVGGHAMPAFIWLPPYGRWSMPPNEYGTREGYTSISLNFFGEGAFHEESYTPARGYFAEGAESPATWVFRRLFQDAVIAVRILEAQPEVDEGRIGAMGLSQGGGLAIWLAAWCHKVKAVAADFPFLSAMKWVMNQRVHRYPLKELADFRDSLPLGREVVAHTLAYFDTVNHATRCQVPTLVTLGAKDPAVKPEQVRAVYDALPGEKELAEIDWGHDWHESMVQRNKAWLDKNL